MHKSSSSFASLHKHWKLNLGVFGCSLVLLLSGQTQAQNSAGSIAARINDRVLTIDDVDKTVAAQVYALQQQVFAIRKAALESLIDRTLLESEASRRNLSVEDLKIRWLDGPVKVDASKVDDLYQKNVAAFGQMSIDEAKAKLRLDLESQARLKNYRDALVELRQKAKLQVLLDEPRIGIIVPVRPALSTGPLKAKIVILEFSDFQCPFCREAQASLKPVLEKYADDVRLEFKNLPLEIHPQASLAARSAYCAGKQDAFWPFHDALFKTSDLSATSINEIAVRLNLDPKDFESCVSSAEAQQAIAADLNDAQRLGVFGTPSFIINGKLFQGALSVRDLETAIQRELGRIQSTNLNLSK